MGKIFISLFTGIKFKTGRLHFLKVFYHFSGFRAIDDLPSVPIDDLPSETYWLTA